MKNAELVGKTILKVMSGALLIAGATVISQLCKSSINDVTKDWISDGRKVINSWKNR